ncbi:NHL repeat-containing protein [Tenacibaculum jejuense]|nr:hypothetical protein [Tenacibaculum jejuense]
MFFILNILGQSIEIDTDYGVNGLTEILSTSNTSVQPYSKQLNDGSLLVSTSRYLEAEDKHEEVIVKYKPDGSIDTSFANNGVYVLDIDLENTSVLYDDNGIELFLDESENIYLYLSPFKNAIVKLNSEGVLETSFGTNGYLITVDDQYENSKNGRVIAYDEGIIVGLVKKDDPQIRILKKYTSNGSIDNTFGNNGILSVPYEGRMFKLNDGDFILSQKYESGTLGFIKISPKGNIDNSFGNNGQVLFDKEGYLNYHEASNNALYVSLTSFEEVNGETKIKTNIYKFDANSGEKDMDFGTNSTVVIEDVFVQESFTELNDKLYIHGLNFKSFDTHIASLNFDGTINSSFEDNGTYIENLNTTKEFSISIFPSENALIIVGKTIQNGTNPTKHFSKKYKLSNATASIDEIEKQKIVFENPIKDKIEVKSTISQINRLDIISLNGRLIKSSKSNIIETKNLPSNIYILNSYLENGNIIRKKIIKK